MDENLYDQLRSQLVCVKCCNYMYQSIWQCSIGHILCKMCIGKLKCCPFDNFAITTNKSLEALADIMHFPCIHRSSGCTEKLTYKKLEEHKAICIFRGYKCGLDECEWIGHLDDVLSHWESKKLTSQLREGNNVCHLQIEEQSIYVNIVQAHNHLFWFKCKVHMEKVFWVVQYIGKPTEAVNYFYEIKIPRLSTQGLCITFSSYCQKSQMNNNEVYADCPQISLDYIKEYLNSQELLVYIMRVKKSTKN